MATSNNQITVSDLTANLVNCHNQFCHLMGQIKPLLEQILVGPCGNEPEGACRNLTDGATDFSSALIDVIRWSVSQHIDFSDYRPTSTI